VISIRFMLLDGNARSRNIQFASGRR
jgi:hypothetical protein